MLPHGLVQKGPIHGEYQIQTWLFKSTCIFWYKSKITNLPPETWLKGKLKQYKLAFPSRYRHPNQASCSVLQCVAVCCSVSQCVAVCRSVLQRVAACCSGLSHMNGSHHIWMSPVTHENQRTPGGSSHSESALHRNSTSYFGHIQIQSFSNIPIWYFSNIATTQAIVQIPFFKWYKPRHTPGGSAQSSSAVHRNNTGHFSDISS